MSVFISYTIPFLNILYFHISLPLFLYFDSLEHFVAHCFLSFCSLLFPFISDFPLFLFCLAGTWRNRICYFYNCFVFASPFMSYPTSAVFVTRFFSSHHPVAFAFRFLLLPHLFCLRFIAFRFCFSLFVHYYRFINCCFCFSHFVCLLLRFTNHRSLLLAVCLLLLASSPAVSLFASFVSHFITCCFCFSFIFSTSTLAVCAFAFRLSFPLQHFTVCVFASRLSFPLQHFIVYAFASIPSFPLQHLLFCVFASRSSFPLQHSSVYAFASRSSFPLQRSPFTLLLPVHRSHFNIHCLLFYFTFLVSTSTLAACHFNICFLLLHFPSNTCCLSFYFSFIVPTSNTFCLPLHFSFIVPTLTLAACRFISITSHFNTYRLPLHFPSIFQL